MLFDKDAGHTVFLEDLYECQSRNIPGGVWASASRPWTDTVSVSSHDSSDKEKTDILL